MAKVMLIEDDNLAARTLEIVFKKAGHHVVSVTDGEDGVRSFRAENPDVVVTDIVMPQKDGIEAVRELCALSAAIPVIAISGGDRTRNLEFLKVASEVGATEVLNKPFSNEAFLKMAEQHAKDFFEG